jgi:hypothetical protein
MYFTGEVLTKLKNPIRQLELVPRCMLQKNPQDPTERTEEKSMVGRVSIAAWSRGNLESNEQLGSHWVTVSLQWTLNGVLRGGITEKISICNLQNQSRRDC